MTRALLYQSQHKWRLGVALAAATVIHLAALGFANNHSPTSAGPPSFSGGPTELTLEPAEQIPDPPTDLSDPLPTPPPTEQSFPDERSTPPPVRRQASRFTPIIRPST